MALWLLLGVAALVSAFLLRPLLAGAAAIAARQRIERGRLRDLVAAKETAYAALQEIEFDHLTRKLDDGDYEALRSRYHAQAVGLLRQIDELRGRDAGAPVPAAGDPARS